MFSVVGEGKKWARLYQREGKKYKLSPIRHTTPLPPPKPNPQKSEQPAPTPCKQTAEWASSWPSQIPCFINKLHYLCLDYFHYRGYLQGYQDPSDLIRSQRDTADNCFLTGLCPQRMRLLGVWFLQTSLSRNICSALSWRSLGRCGGGRGGGGTDLKQGSPFLSLSLENFLAPC